jgi:hypothetical protein
VRFEFLRFWFPLAVGGVGFVLHQTVDGSLAVQAAAVTNRQWATHSRSLRKE